MFEEIQKRITLRDRNKNRDLGGESNQSSSLPKQFDIVAPLASLCCMQSDFAFTQ